MGMFEEDFRVPAPDEEPQGRADLDLDFLEGLDEYDLLLVRSAIDSRLPPPDLQSLNLEHELVRQFQTARALQTLVLSGGEEANKKAQTLNACAAALQALIKMQSEFHTAERLKNIESKLIRALEHVPAEALTEFFEWYEQEAAR